MAHLISFICSVSVKKICIDNQLFMYYHVIKLFDSITYYLKNFINKNI